MLNFSEFDTAIYFIQYVCQSLFRRKAGAKIGKNMNKKGKGWKNTTLG